MIIELFCDDHEEFIRKFEYELVIRSGNGGAIGQHGSIRASRSGSAAKKEADATFGPRRNTSATKEGRFGSHLW
jgi:hypothetical protein